MSKKKSMFPFQSAITNASLTFGENEFISLFEFYLRLFQIINMVKRRFNRFYKYRHLIVTIRLLILYFTIILL